MNEYVEKPLKSEDIHRVPVHAPIKETNTPTFASLYTVKKCNKEKERLKILKADINVIQCMLTAYNKF